MSGARIAHCLSVRSVGYSFRFITPVVSQNVGVKFFEQMGLYTPVEMQTYDPNRPMTDSTTIHLTGGIKVDPQEHISTVGRFTESSHRDLLTLYTDLSKEAQKKPWNPSLGGMWR